jgi:general secretion pathway protein B
LALAALLVVNLVVLTLVLLRKSPEPTVAQATPAIPAASQPTTSAPAPTTAQASSPSSPQAPAPLAEEATPPATVQYETIPREESPLDIAPPEGPTLVKPIEKAVAPPTFTANGLPELHIDMHVYANNPKDRFVLINMHKYTEGQLMSEGPRLDEITPEGVTLFFKGQQLSLPRP